MHLETKLFFEYYSTKNIDTLTQKICKLRRFNASTISYSFGYKLHVLPSQPSRPINKIDLYNKDYILSRCTPPPPPPPHPPPTPPQTKLLSYHK